MKVCMIFNIVSKLPYRLLRNSHQR